MQAKEDYDALEIVKEYLKQHGLKNTFDCLEKESSDRKKVIISITLRNSMPKITNQNWVKFYQKGNSL
jgi:hypothetical protein